MERDLISQDKAPLMKNLVTEWPFASLRPCLQMETHQNLAKHYIPIKEHFYYPEPAVFMSCLIVHVNEIEQLW